MRPERIYGRSDVLRRASPVPAASGVYAWFFRALPDAAIDASDCVSVDGMPLLYVGIAPKPPPANLAKPSRQSLRSRIRHHYSGDAAGSTLRLTLGCLLESSIGTELRRVGSGSRLTFGAEEATLSQWMEENAFVTWVETREPWTLEQAAFKTLDLPLNLQHNSHNRFHSRLTAVRSAARERARLKSPYRQQPHR